MSFTTNDRNLRGGLGKGFPVDPAADVDAVFARVVAEALDEDFGGSPSKAKHLARPTGVNERTVQNWLQARNGPTGAGLVMLMRHSDAVARAVLRMSGRPALARESDMRRLQLGLEAALAAIAACLGER